MPASGQQANLHRITLTCAVLDVSTTLWHLNVPLAFSSAFKAFSSALSCSTVGRFNERMVLSLASNPSCLLVDDELNILPTSRHVRSIEPLPADAAGTGQAVKDSELKGLSESLADTLVCLEGINTC